MRARGADRWQTPRAGLGWATSDDWIDFRAALA